MIEKYRYALPEAPWDGLGTEPLTDEEWRAWLRKATREELEHQVEIAGRRVSGMDAQDELDRRDAEEDGA